MSYFINRNGQQYGPYLAEDVCRYLEQGSLFLSDLARTDGSSSWVPLGQLITPASPAPPPPLSHSSPSILAPPSLHWFLVLLLTWLTGEIFFIVWALVQSSWVRKIDPHSRATRDYILGLMLPILGTVILVVGYFINHDSDDDPTYAIGIALMILGGACYIAGLALVLKAIFGIKASLEHYYNTVEPIDLRLSGVMTFFFNVVYFQYHMTRIADWKHTGILEG